MSKKRRRSKRQTIDVEQLKSDPNSFLSWGIEDTALRKLEMYRLYHAGYAANDIAEAFGYARGYLYEMWAKFETEGVEALVDKRWGAAPRKRTTEREAAVLRAKALNPERGDADLAEEFGMERSTIYHLLKEHELQDLHRVLGDANSRETENRSLEAKTENDEKGGAKSSLVNSHCS
jgi:transposase